MSLATTTMLLLDPYGAHLCSEEGTNGWITHVLSSCSLVDACCFHTSAADCWAWIQGAAVWDAHSFFAMVLLQGACCYIISETWML
jgi:hypothetical protein